MGDFLIESNARANTPTVLQIMKRGANAKYEHDIKVKCCSLVLLLSMFIRL
jgi:hypothetical protein